MSWQPIHKVFSVHGNKYTRPWSDRALLAVKLNILVVWNENIKAYFLSQYRATLGYFNCSIFRTQLSFIKQAFLLSLHLVPPHSHVLLSSVKSKICAMQSMIYEHFQLLLVVVLFLQHFWDEVCKKKENPYSTAVIQLSQESRSPQESWMHVTCYNEKKTKQQRTIEHVSMQ